MNPPLLSSSSVLLLLSAFSASYLSSIYLVPSARIRLPSPSTPTSENDPADIASPPGERRDRNHPSVIKSRLIAVSLSSLSSLVSIPYVLSKSSFSPSTYSASIPRALELLGLVLPRNWSETLRLLVYPLGLTASLFAGSLYIQYLEGDLPLQKKGGTWKSLRGRFDSWRGIRNFVIAPLTEELTFRSCIVGISFLGGWNRRQLVFLTPLWFGLAHVHHAYENWLAGGKTKKALLQSILVSTFQFAYTTLFGWYATFLFLRTGSIIPPVLVHSFCNAMGLPPLGWALQVYPERKISLWTTYFLGIGGFVYGLWRWTEPALFGGSVYWR
ncbi:CAAX prenyl protease [Sporobolomyces salmoneus]|uniref:CAAX prenyl protease n=1 Tax=Sporobolomyces salmoneus TaxID=183962 RepID=UPI003174BC0F